MNPYGHCVRDLAQLAGVTPRTARRWKAAGRVPEPYATRVALVLDADLGALSIDWKGWTIRRGELVSPEGLQLLPRQIRALPLQLEALKAHQVEATRNRTERELARALRHAADDLHAALTAAEAAMHKTRQLLRQAQQSGMARKFRASADAVTVKGFAQFA